jgi:hypothetical protein
MGSPKPRVEERAPTAPAGSALAREVADRIASLHVPNRTPRDKVRPRSGLSPFGPSLVASFWGKWAVSQLTSQYSQFSDIGADGGTRTRTPFRGADFHTTSAFAAAREKAFVVWTIPSP